GVDDAEAAALRAGACRVGGEQVRGYAVDTGEQAADRRCDPGVGDRSGATVGCHRSRSEEHTSELQSRFDLVCRLLLEKKTNNRETSTTTANVLASISAVRSSTPSAPAGAAATSKRVNVPGESITSTECGGRLTDGTAR